MKDIAIYGAGGFGREVACLIKRINSSGNEPVWNLIGFFDDGLVVGTRNEYGEVLGGINELNAWDKELSLAVGIGSPKAVYAVINKISNKKIDFPNIIDPTVVIADKDNYTLGKGNVFAANCIISIAVRVGDFNTFNNNTVLGHDDEIGSYNSFMPNVNVSGGVVIGDKNFLGVKSTVLQYLKIGNEVTVGGNSLIIRNTKDGYLYMGIPAKKIEL